MVLGYFIIQFLQWYRLDGYSSQSEAWIPSSISKSQSEAEELRNPVLTSKSKIIWKLDFVSERFCPKIEGFSQNRVCIF